MNLKKKLKKFFTLSRQHEAGFTLVELIVVIAILGILGGVGTVGYSGYIKNANKKADMTLVGNIIRAIETGTNSLMFVNDDSMVVGSITYPVGVIVLSENGTQVITSGASNKTVSGECEFVTVENVVCITKGRAVCACAHELEDNVYKEIDVISEPKTITYCTTHSTGTIVTLSSLNNYTTGWGADKGTRKTFLGSPYCKNHGFDANTTPVSSGTTVCEDFDYIYEPTSAGVCELVANPGINNGTTKTNEETHALTQAIKAAFGEDLTALSLKHNDWKSDEKMEYATANAYLDETYTDIKKLTSDFTEDPALSIAAAMITGVSYDDPEEMMIDVCDIIAKRYENKEDEWLQQWDKASRDAYTACSFGLNSGTGEDQVTYFAVRKMYNNAFASYLLAHGVPEKYANVIRDFSRSIAGVDVPMPALANTSAFKVDDAGNNASGLMQRFKDKDDTNAGQEGSWFNKCAALYETYKVSEVCKENAMTVLNLANTIDQNMAQAQASGSYMTYYENYFKELDALYTAAETAAGDGIVIIVVVENGLVKCEVYPSAANPRND